MDRADDSYRRLVDHLPDGYAYHEVVVDNKGKPVDYVFIDVNPAFETLTGLSREQLVGRKASEVLAGIEHSGFDWFGTYGLVALSGESASFEQYAEPLGRWFDVTAYSDRPGHFSTVFHDITSRRQTEEALRASEQRYRSLFEHSLDASYLGRPDGTVLDVNQAWLDLFGYSREDLASVNAVSFYAEPADRDVFIHRMAQTGFVQDEVLYRRKDGTTFWCQRSQVALKDESGAVVAYQGVMRDVTERRQAEAALRESEEKYRTLFRLSRDAIYLVQPDGTFVEVNQAWLDMLGCSPEDVAKFDAAHWYANPDDRAVFRKRLAAAGDMLDDEVQLRRKDGTVFDCQRRNVVQRDEHGNIRAFQGVMRDVTEMRNAERALRKSEEEYRSLFEQSMDPIVLVEIDGSNIRANQAWLDLFGYSREELPNLNIANIYENPDDRRQFLRTMAEAGLVEDEVRLKKKDGTVFDCQRRFVARRDEHGNAREFQGVMRDVTEIRNAERALRKSEEEYRSLFEQSMDAIMQVEVDGSNLRANQAWLDLFGYSREELPTLNIVQVYANPDNRKDFLRRIAQTGVIEDEVRFKKKDGTVFDCARTVTERRDEHRNVVGFQGIMKDVTQQKHDRAELERLARFDPLTGLLNRRSIMEKLAEWISHVRRYKGRLSVAMLDIDHFKRVNDLHGHLVGDRVLADAANMVQQSVRLTDFAGRYGGEEFLVILPRTDAAGAATAAERIRASLQGLPIMNDARGKPSRVTASIGVAEWRVEDNEDTLVGRADAALYVAKKAGRNRVEVASHTGPSE
jgi:diguanylate cyclase (GGDEF)-like protein/PAS domain S-box-containing protein